MVGLEYSVDLRIDASQDEDQKTVISKLNEILSGSKYSWFELNDKSRDSRGMVFNAPDKSYIIIHSLRKGGYHVKLLVRSENEKTRYEANQITNKIIDFFLVIPTVTIKQIELDGDFKIAERNLPMLKIIDPQPLLQITEKSGLHLSPYSIALTTVFEDWDILYYLIGHTRTEALEKEDEDLGSHKTPSDMLFLHRDFKKTEKDVINKVYETAKGIEKRLELMKGVFQSGT